MRVVVAWVACTLSGCSFDVGGVPVAPASPLDAEPPDSDRPAADGRELDAPAPLDATADASPQMPCPDDYRAVAAAASTSVYRAGAGAARWRTAEDDCEGDGRGT